MKCNIVNADTPKQEDSARRDRTSKRSNKYVFIILLQTNDEYGDVVGRRDI